MDPHVLVIEDSDDIAMPLVRMLEREGYVVSWTEDGASALAHLASKPVDVAILDLGLPDMDGLEVCQRARDAGFEGGIMIVTARAEELDRVVGLDYGADDYLAKPFSVAELQARVRALLRRSAPRRPAEVVITAGQLRIDVAARRVFSGDREIQLTTKEFDVLALLDGARDTVVSRQKLMDEVWDHNWYGSTKTLDVTVGRLRQKLDEAGVQEKVVTVRGVGFRLETA
ncbi:response regulator transcription factor [Nocardioides pacificus]